MDTDKVVYFLDCYCITMNYGETPEQITAEFAAKEAPALTAQLVSQMASILSAASEDAIDGILSRCIAYNRDSVGLKALLESSLRLLQKATNPF